MVNLKRILTLSAPFVAFLGSGSGFASPAATDGNSGNETSAASGGGQTAVTPHDSALQEIIVTAQKRTERLSDVPMSITAASKQQLQQIGITDTNQLEKLVPGFTYQQTNFGVPVFSLRGIGDFDTTLGVSPAVSVYMDQIALPYSAMTRGSVLDLERVEVLKGPQGTLFGQNSTGGAINYIAAKPTENFEAGTTIDYGRFNEFDTEEFVSGPLAQGLSARVALRTEERGDWQQNYTRSDELGAKHFYNGRVLLDWAPDAGLNFELSLNGWKDTSDSQAPQFMYFSPTVPLAAGGYPPAFKALAGYPAAPQTPQAADWDEDSSLRRDDNFYQVGLHADWRISDSVSLNSLTAYSLYKTLSPTDTDGTDYRDLTVIIDGRLNSFSQELRLNGKYDERLNWMIGGNYQRDTADEAQTSLLGSTNSTVGPLHYDDLVAINDQRVRTASAFGGIDFGFTEQLTAQGSVRYTHQDRDFTGCTADAGDGQLASAFGLLSTILSGSPTTIASGSCVTFGPNFKPLPAVDSELNQNNISWRGGLNWKVDPHTLMYANITKGFKAGGFPTIPAAFESQLTPIRQESVLAYEMGFKISPVRTLQLDGAAFYYDYKDKQILGYAIIQPFGNLPELVSIPKSRVDGAELQATWRPIEGLTLSAGGTYVDSRVQSNPVNPVDPFGNTSNFVGEQFPSTPHWQGLLNTQYEFALANQLNGFIGANGSYRSASYAAFGDSPSFKIDDYGLLDLRTGIKSSDGAWRLEFWGRNVTNKYYWNTVEHVTDAVTRITGMPRTYGVSVSYRFLH
jgi:iron complex outermembrane recepter protein